MCQEKIVIEGNVQSEVISSVRIAIYISVFNASIKLTDKLLGP